MRRTAAILALVAVVSLLGASDVRGGSAGVPAGKTTGYTLTATIVMDLTNIVGGGPPFFFAPGKGLTSIRIQRSSFSAAALFTSGVIFGPSCAAIKGETDFRFIGLMNAWVSPASVRTSLFAQFGDPDKAAIVDTDNAECTTVVGGAGGGNREVLSFTATIQFQP